MLERVMTLTKGTALSLPCGLPGADLQNLMNEAAILAARRNLKEISKDEISDALERIVAGPEKKGAVMNDKKRKLVAYHEAGHALVRSVIGKVYEGNFEIPTHPTPIFLSCFLLFRLVL